MDKSRKRPPQADLELSGDFLDLPLKAGEDEPADGVLETTAQQRARAEAAESEAVTELIEPTLVGRTPSPGTPEPSATPEPAKSRRPIIRRVSAEEADHKRRRRGG